MGVGQLLQLAIMLRRIPKKTTDVGPMIGENRKVQLVSGAKKSTHGNTVTSNDGQNSGCL